MPGSPSFGHRCFPTPGLNHGIRSQLRVHYLIPADHGFAVLFKKTFQAPVEISMQFSRRLQLVLAHESLNGSRTLPLRFHYFIATDMKIGIGKQGGDLANESIQESIGG